jgi:hypothetical protein
MAEGDWEPPRLVMLEFEDFEAAPKLLRQDRG